MPTLQFLGKPFVENYHLVVPYRPLIPQPERSVNLHPTTNDNLIIHGDNLHALKALLPEFERKIKCVYIDPPYNTGNEDWAYNDNVSSPLMHEWLRKAVNREDQSRHDKWLCMMMPRLQLLHELLRDDGVIFISIDDNEVHHLRMLMDALFGEEQFIAQLVWEQGRKNDAKLFSIGHQYILVYARSRETLNNEGVVWREEKPGAREIQEKYLELRAKYSKDNEAIQRDLRQFYVDLPKSSPAKKHARYSNIDDRGVWRDDNMSWPGGGGPTYDVVHPITKKVCIVPDGGWRYATPEKMKEMIDNGYVIFREDETKPPIRKTYLVRSNNANEDQFDETDSDIGIQVMESVFYKSALSATKILAELFKSKIKPFDNPKDHLVLARLIRYCTAPGDIILDSFAGSGSTGQAVLELNRQDAGNRRFILIEMEDYADKLTAERLRRVIHGVPEAKDENLRAGSGGSFSYYELGEPIDMIKLLDGEALPDYVEFGRVLFHTATGETFNPAAVNRETSYLGQSARFDVYLLYEPSLDWLKKGGLTKEILDNLPESKREKLIFAPACYAAETWLHEHRVRYVQLPYEIFFFQGR